MGSLTNLISLWLDYNELSGSLPASLANLSQLTEIRLQGNDFSGSVPTELCALRSGVFGEVVLEQVEADCLPDQFTGAVEIACEASCCTLCCDGNGNNCLHSILV